jgi:hypothetical protein
VRPHLLVAVSSHGLGHLGQVAPVVNALRARRPELRLTFRTALTRAQLARRVEGPFERQACADDFGMRNTSALDVDVDASAAAYRDLHARWPDRVAAVAEELSATGADLILADAPYLTCAAADSAGIPVVALCSLNWADIYWHYCRGRPEAPRIYAQMLEAYGAARAFLRPAPSMPMEDLANTLPIGPIAGRGERRREALAHARGIGDDEKLVLVAMGGIRTRLPMERWPALPGIRWVVQADWDVRRDDVITLEDLAPSFPEALACCDALITKPGYGSFAEAAAAGVPVLYVPRGDWPESAYLVRWLADHAHCAEVSRESLEGGGFAATLRELLERGAYPPVPPDGVAEAAAFLADLLPTGARAHEAGR